MRHTIWAATMATALLAGFPTAAWSQPNCRNTGNFANWLADFKREAQAQKISAAAIAGAAPHMVLDQRIINIERGDLQPSEMIGSWAGELGQTQMMPSEYMAHAIDYDGDGRRNLIRSVSDVIGSTGKYLVYLGWKRGEPWMHEVRVPQNLKWDQADLSIQHPISQWA